jgi:hypothetical protein
MTSEEVDALRNWDVSTANPDQEDEDDDGDGDICDACPGGVDEDEDGLCSDEDNCPDVANGDQSDIDGDEVGDACDNCSNQDCNSRTIFLNDNCHEFDDDEESCENSYISGGSGIVPCYFGPSHDSDEERCNGCGENNREDGFCDVACEAKGDCPGRTNVEDDEFEHCRDLEEEACEDYYMETGQGYITSCFWNDAGEEGECEACGPSNMEDEGCVNVCAANEDQIDSDEDGIGNICDASQGEEDSDQDGINDEDDNCDDTANASQDDQDGDGVGDLCDNCANQECNSRRDFVDDCDDIGSEEICNLSYDNTDGLTPCFWYVGEEEEEEESCRACTDEEIEEGDCEVTCEAARICPDRVEVDSCGDLESEECEEYYEVDDFSDRLLSCFQSEGGCSACDDPEDDGCENVCSANDSQADQDDDDAGDSCDIDADDDGFDYDDDNCPAVSNEGQDDSDDDGIGNSCDFCPDEANFGIVDIELTANEMYYDWDDAEDPSSGEVTCVEDCRGSEDLDSCLAECDLPMYQFLACECGDGFLSPFEECDDGNGKNGDGCSSECEVEEGGEEGGSEELPAGFTNEFFCTKLESNEVEAVIDLEDTDGHAITTANDGDPAQMFAFQTARSGLARREIGGIRVINESTHSGEEECDGECDTNFIYIFNYELFAWEEVGTISSPTDDSELNQQLDVEDIVDYISPEGWVYVKVISDEETLANDYTAIVLTSIEAREDLTACLPEGGNYEVDAEGDLQILDDDGDKIAEIPSGADASAAETEQNDEDDLAGFTIIRGVDLLPGQTKIGYVDRVAETDRLCIVDDAEVTVDELPVGGSSCTGTLIDCPGEVGGYSCRIVGDQYKVSGLLNSAAIEVQANAFAVSGGSTNPLGDLNIWINSNAKETSSRNVTLTFDVENADEMALSNEPSFQGVAWEPYASSKLWTLGEGTGVQTVYAYFRNSQHTSPMVADTITLTGQPSLSGATAAAASALGLLLLVAFGSSLQRKKK